MNRTGCDYKQTEWVDPLDPTVKECRFLEWGMEWVLKDVDKRSIEYTPKP